MSWCLFPFRLFSRLQAHTCFGAIYNIQGSIACFSLNLICLFIFLAINFFDEYDVWRLICDSLNCVDLWTLKFSVFLSNYLIFRRLFLEKFYCCVFDFEEIEFRARWTVVINDSWSLYKGKAICQNSWRHFSNFFLHISLDFHPNPTEKQIRKSINLFEKSSDRPSHLFHEKLP